ncbi:hypothetical protein EYB33_05900 [Lysinibacillus sphaericus]|uniref:hypothetical protein n=1 Tax=Lysinibacillus sphaericus TaxID=1421 RepID=UPI001E50CA8A|nr:hypothetical protein [Lysinibacillus sphaericus]MCS1380867.1 hypothetical protein [Lysinibacillus sphaericus]UDK95841.1 hypothetical protein EYB33_05900 [Lysinibacillus sphaericus]
MTTILIAVLFVLQLLSFYFIIILNTKLAKFKDLEVKQERLMREMDDTISLYLAEMKDENNRLIQALQVVPKPTMTPDTGQQAQPIAVPKSQGQPLSQTDGEKKAVTVNSILMPKNIVANAYSRQQQGGTTAVQTAAPKVDSLPKEESKPLTMEQQIVQMAEQGKTAEEIAKKLQKGKTEIELLLKFHS